MNNRILTTLFALALCLPLFIGVVPAEADAATCDHPTNQREVVLAKPATCTEKGNIQYYVCMADGCHKRFPDATTKVAYNDMSAVETPMVAHVSDGEWYYGSVNHWNKCVNCGAEMNKTAHAFTIPTPVEGNDTAHAMYCACGARQVDGVNHSFEEKTTPEGHTNTCKDCGKVRADSGAHVDAEKADNTPGKDCKCDICGYNLEHVYGDWCPDATAHAHLCQNCGNIKDWGEHTFKYENIGGDDHSKVCTVCGYPVASEHCSEGAVVDHNCDQCGDPLTHRWDTDAKAGSYVAAKPAKCSEPGNIEYETCSICERPFGYDGEILTEDELVVAALGHDFKTEWDWTKTEHYHKCSRTGCSEKDAKAEHTFTYKYNNNGTHDKVCSVCGYKVPGESCSIKEKCTCACGHLFVHRASDAKMVYTSHKDPTCEEDGNTSYYTCKDCGNRFVKTVSDDSSVQYTTPGDPTLQKLGHDWKNEMTVSGKHLQRCARCEISEYQDHTSSTGGCTCDIVLKNGKVCGQLVHSHEVVKVPRKAPTCQEKGYEAYWQYKGCGRMFANDFARTEIDEPIAIAKVDHEPGEWEKDGDEHVKCCEICGEELESGEHVDTDFDNRCDECDCALDLVPHAAKPATCTESGNKAYYTSKYTQRSYWDEAGTQRITDMDDTLIPALGHDDYVHDLENGKHQVKCDRCERTLTAEAHTFTGCFCTECGAANGTHTATTFERVEATCDKDGHEAYAKCSCGKYYNVLGEETTYSALVLKAPGHKWGTEIFNDNAAGKHYAVCKTCNAKNYSEHELTVNDPLSGNYHQFVCKCGKVTTEVHYDRNGDKVCDVKGCDHDMSNKQVTVNNNPSTTVVTGDKNTVNNRWSWLKNWLNNTKPSTAGGSEKPEQAAKPDGAGTGSPSGNTVVPPSSGSTTTPSTGSNTGSTGAGSSNAGSSTQGGSQTAEATGVLQYVISFFNWIFSGFGG